MAAVLRALSHLLLRGVCESFLRIQRRKWGLSGNYGGLYPEVDWEYNYKVYQAFYIWTAAERGAR